MRLLDSIKSLISEAIEWNDGDYDYQHGYCHYFAYDIIGKLKELYPEKDIRYLLLLGAEYEEGDDEPIQEYLIHVYIAIDNYLLDSNGFSTWEEADERLDDWEQRQYELIPEDYELVVDTQETNEIPEWFFNNKFCNTNKVKKDIEKFLSHPEVIELLQVFK